MTEPGTHPADDPVGGDGLSLGADDAEQDDLEFQPRQRRGLHWLTLLLIALAIWGAGFLVGVLTDRALAGVAG
ncbi:MAG: hypothetical protein CVT65_00370 [Actinobacteria bacterium HGW-Actinobacteria-5]|jgi:hypothetical protein|nr:MAG: hypothetical protein CVT65_00370 [Actinobacteria bacterium HGW-Actinobacteria-5]